MTARPAPRNAPRERSPLVGRERELAAIARALAEGARLVTLHGAPGMGKSRIARRFLRTAAEHGYELAFRANLAGVRTLEQMVWSVARAVAPGGFAEGQERAAVAAALQGRRALLLLDGCEGLPPEAAEQVGDWLDALDGLDVLSASRARLGIEGERTLAVGPLPPEDAARLFQRCARAVRPPDADGAASLDEPGAVRELVAHLDHIPLAIEITAARAAVMTAGEMLARLRAGAPLGEEPLRSAVAWSYALLRPHEQLAFAQCSVFVGGFTLSAAERVLRLPPGAPPVLAAVQGLVDQAMVAPASTAAAPTRFHLYEALRQYGEERLRALGLAEETERRHAACYAELGAQEPKGYAGVDGRRALAELVRERENLLGAYRRSRGRDPRAAAALALVLDPLLIMQGPFTLHEEILQEAAALAERAGAHEERIGALRALGRLYGLRGDAGPAERAHRDAIALCREHGGPAQLAGLLGLLAQVLSWGPRVDEAFESAAEARELARAAGDARPEALAEKALGLVARNRGRLAEAVVHLRRAAAIARRARADRLHALALVNLGEVLGEQGELQAAHAALLEGRAALTAMGDGLHMMMLAPREARVLRLLGRAEEAEALCRGALPTARDFHDPRNEALLYIELGHLAADAGDAARAERALDDAAEALRGRSDRLLRHLFDELALRLGGRGAGADGPELLVLGDVEAIEAGGARLELLRRPRIRQVLRVLLTQRRAAPGVGLSVQDLFSAAWPGERAHPSSISARVYMAVRTLRALGLRDLLLTREGRYLLSPEVRVRTQPGTGER